MESLLFHRDFLTEKGDSILQGSPQISYVPRYFCRLHSFWYLGLILTFRLPWSMFVRSLSVLLFKFKYKFICFNLDLSNQLFLKQNSTKKIKAKTCQVCQSANLHIKHNIKRSGYVTFSIIAYKIPYRIPRLLHNFCTILK